MTELKTIDFHGDKIETFEASGDRWVAMRRICENLGMNWAGQLEKLRNQSEKFSCMDIHTTGPDGKTYEMAAVPTRKLALWLACINPNKVAAHVRPKLERYQEECAVALNDYWTKGAAFNDRAFPPDVREMLERMFGIERMLSHKVTEIERAIPIIVGQTVEAAIAADARRAVLDYASVRQLLEEAGAVPKGRKSLNRRIGYRLGMIARSEGGARRCPHTGVWLYPRVMADRFMREEGCGLVGAHNARASGQGVFQFKKPGAK